MLNFRREAFNYVRAKITETLATETPKHFTKIGITVVPGEAIFTGLRTIRVGNEDYTFTQAIIATGSSPRPGAVATRSWGEEHVPAGGSRRRRIPAMRR